MKKFLSLVLALVMTMSLVTISAGAEDFTDADEMNYLEAVEVMSAINVIDGYADDSFKPQNGLTRGAAAKIICNMILGPTTAGALSADTAPYSDVSVNNTFAGYIAYCAKEGIISGYADGTFRPSAPLTGYAFMKMLLGALGYDADVEQYVGSNWSINVAKRALNIGLDDGLVDDFVGTKALTREEAALYAFNTLAAAMVEYETSSTIVVGDITIKNNSVAKEVEEGKVQIWDDDVLNFAEKYFPKLEINEDVEEDAFGRPAHGSLYKGDEVGTYADEADLTYTGAEYDKDLIKDLKEDYNFSKAKVWYNGSKDEGAKLTDLNRNGYSIELFINDDDEVTDIVVIEAYAAEITEINLDDDDEVESVELTVYEAQTTETLVIDVEDNEDAYELIADYEEEDILMVVVTPGWDTADEDDYDDVLLAVDDVETVEGVVTTTKLDSGNNGWIKVDGVKYEMAWEYSQVKVAVDAEGVFYLYNGYVVHADVDGDDDAQYAYVARIGSEKDKFGGQTYFAEVVYTDGTSETIEIDKASYEMVDADSNDGKFIVSYEYDDDDEVYNLKKVSSWIGAAAISKGKTAIKVGDSKKATADGETVYVIIELDGKAVDDVTVYTGYKSVKSVKTTGTWVIKEDGIATYVFAIY